MIIKVPQSKDLAANEQNEVSSESVIQDEATVNAMLNAPKDIKRLSQLKVALLLPFNPDNKMQPLTGLSNIMKVCYWQWIVCVTKASLWICPFTIRETVLPKSGRF